VPTVQLLYYLKPGVRTGGALNKKVYT